MNEAWPLSDHSAFIIRHLSLPFRYDLCTPSPLRAGIRTATWGDAMAEDIEARGGEAEGGDEGVLTRVCVTCGKEYFFADAEPPEGMSCERCGSTIFRS